MSNLRSPLELWGGAECTINRVNGGFPDQLERSGHRQRSASDLDLFASLGLRTLRIALHWEYFDWTRAWAAWDLQMAQIERLGIRPIVGLVHHGSGPLWTNLLDPEFPEKLAEFALEVAQRYPHILDYTPVNEPQTTSRFSCLYGFWYPHRRGDMRGYVRALYHQIKGIVLAMRAIRTVQPAARLVHTEDAGATFSPPTLESFRAQRELRRWLGADLLCGRVTASHPLFDFLLEHGLSQQEILWFRDNRCPPDILGLNYYVTSDRYLDDRVELYPGMAGGDTGTEPLADIEAVRVRAEGILGAGALLDDAWARFGLPMAITEAHLGCEPLEQTRWLAEVWREAQAARARGVDVRAVTAWALLGSFDWCSLCTEERGAYEPGLFDLSSGEPVATPLARLAFQLLNGIAPDRAAQEPGWWHHGSRLTLPPAIEEERAVEGPAAR